MKTYLRAYNGFQLLVWIVILLNILYHGTMSAYSISAVRFLCILSHFLMYLEFVHGLLNLIPTNLVNCFTQVSARNAFIWGYLEINPDTRTGFLLFLIWCLAEIVRYSYYFSAASGKVPYIITWLRYSSFIVLYVVGVASECWIVYESISIIQNSNPKIATIEMPNWFNFGFDFLIFTCYVVPSLYIMLFPNLYWSMLMSRKSKLAKEKLS